MSLEQTLNDTLTQAIRDKDQRMADIVRMIKSRITERRTAKGFSGQIDDAAGTNRWIKPEDRGRPGRDQCGPQVAAEGPAGL